MNQKRLTVIKVVTKFEQLCDNARGVDILWHSQSNSSLQRWERVLGMQHPPQLDVALFLKSVNVM